MASTEQVSTRANVAKADVICDGWDMRRPPGSSPPPAVGSFGNPAGLIEVPWLCAPISRWVCLFGEVAVVVLLRCLPLHRLIAGTPDRPVSMWTDGRSVQNAGPLRRSTTGKTLAQGRLAAPIGRIIVIGGWSRVSTLGRPFAVRIPGAIPAGLFKGATGRSSVACMSSGRSRARVGPMSHQSYAEWNNGHRERWAERAREPLLRRRWW